MFSQLSSSERLRDLIATLTNHHIFYNLLGMDWNVSRSFLDRANQSREHRFFEKYSFYLAIEARQIRITDIFKLGGNMYTFDLTTIDLFFRQPKHPFDSLVYLFSFQITELYKNHW